MIKRYDAVLARKACGFTVLLFLALVFPPNAVAQEPLLVEADAKVSTLASSQKQILQAIRDEPETARIHIIRLAGSPTTLLEKAESFSISVAPGKSVVVLKEKIQQRGPNDLSWSGSVQGGRGSATFVLGHEGFTGTLQTVTPGGEIASYNVAPLGSGLHAIAKLNPRKFPPEHPSG